MTTKHIPDESGAETVEFALSIPFILVIALAIFQIAIVGLQLFILDGQVTNASWNVNASEVAASTQPEEVVKTAICRDTLLSEDKITVRNMQVTTETESTTTNLRSSSANTKLGITQYVHDKGTVHITCDVDYKCSDVVAIPGIDKITLTKHLDQMLVDTDRVEVK